MIRKYTIDETFFDNIDTEEKAYILGFVSADGYNAYPQRDRFKIAINETDIDIIEKIRDAMKSNHPIHRYDMNNVNCMEANFSITSKTICKKLYELGIKTNKGYELCFPDYLSQDLVRHYIRGHLDANGCISQSKTVRYRWQIGINGSQHLCNGILKHLSNNLGITGIVKPDRKSNVLKIRGRLQIGKVLEYLYGNAKIYMNRKFQKNLKFWEIDEEIKNGKWYESRN